MAAGDDERKLLCECGKPLAAFTREGLELYCRFSKETTIVRYAWPTSKKPSHSSGTADGDAEGPAAARVSERARLRDWTLTAI